MVVFIVQTILPMFNFNCELVSKGHGTYFLKSVSTNKTHGGIYSVKNVAEVPLYLKNCKPIGLLLDAFFFSVCCLFGLTQ